MMSWITKKRFIRLTLLLGLIFAGYRIYQYWTDHFVTFRYRLTVEIEIDGQSQSASSIIETYYAMGNFEFYNWRAEFAGVSPLFDLGPRGYLAAALDHDTEELKRRQQLVGVTADLRIPLDARRLPLAAYSVNPRKIRTARGKVLLEPKHYPIFVWVPPPNRWQEAWQMFHDEIPQLGPAGVVVVAVYVEPAPRAPLSTNIDPAPEWLLRARSHGDGRSDTPSGYIFDIAKFERKKW